MNKPAKSGYEIKYFCPSISLRLMVWLNVYPLLLMLNQLQEFIYVTKTEITLLITLLLHNCFLYILIFSVFPPKHAVCKVFTVQLTPEANNTEG